jgi:hypothetical protein
MGARLGACNGPGPVQDPVHVSLCHLSVSILIHELATTLADMARTSALHARTNVWAGLIYRVTYYLGMAPSVTL